MVLQADTLSTGGFAQVFDCFREIGVVLHNLLLCWVFFNMQEMHLFHQAAMVPRTM